MRVFTPVEVEIVRDLVRKVRLEHPVFGALDLRWTVTDEAIWLRLAADVQLVGSIPEAGTWREVGASISVDPYEVRAMLRAGEHDLAARMLGALARHHLFAFVTHEVDEMVLVDGRRLFDPHGPNADPFPDSAIESADVRKLVPVVPPPGVAEVNAFAPSE